MKRIVKTISQILFPWKKLSKKKQRWLNIGAYIAIVVMIPISIYVLKHAGEASAAWFDTNFSYRQRMDITNPGSAQTDFQISFLLDTSTLITAGKMQSDCDDIRITDANGKVLPFWIETGAKACNTSMTSIWAKVPSIPTSGATLYVYYGNPQARAYSDGNKVFEFFDDFSGSSIDGNKWSTGTTNSTSGTDWSVSGGNLNGGNQNRYIQSVKTFTGDYTTQTRSFTTTDNANGFSVAGFWASTSNSFGILDHDNTSYYRNDSSWVNFTFDGTGQWSRNTAQVVGTNATYTRVGETSGSSTATGITNSGLSAEGVRLGARYDSSAFDQNFVATWDWVFVRKAVSSEPYVNATGGIVTQTGGYTIHTFLTSGTFTPGPGITSVDALVVAGGGGGGSSTASNGGGGGGGAGGLVYNTGFSVSPSSYSVTVGGGGAGGTTAGGVTGTNGSNSVFSSITATGGGGGGNGTSNNNNSGQNGGSGGGAGWNGYVTDTVGTGTGGQGNNGGQNGAPSGAGGGGGGGAGAAGSAPTNSPLHNGGNGGNGTANSISGSSVTYAGGGGGGAGAGSSSGGTGGGGGDSGGIGANGTANTGGGGGGAYSTGAAGTGGSGIVIIRYLTPVSEESAPGPVGYWKFDEGTGQSTNDSSSNNNAGTLGATSASASDDPTWQTKDQCISDKCLFFDGTNDLVKVPDSNTLDFGTGDFTVEAWTRHSETGERRYVYKYNTDTTRGFSLGSANGSNKAYFIIYTTGGTAQATATSLTDVNDNKWHHIVGVRSGTTIYIYVDGKQEASATGASADVSGASALFIGSDVTPANFLQGYIDEPKVYNYARTTAQIKTELAKYGSVLGATANQNLSNGLVGYWKMDESSWATDCSTTSVTDSSGNGNNGKPCPNASAATVTSVSKFGNAGNFDGTNDYVLMGNPSSLQITGALTFSTWIKGTSFSNTPMIFNKSDNGSQDGYQAYINSSGIITVRMDDDGTGYATTLNSTTALSTSTWYYITIVLDPSKSLTIYINGVQDAKTTSSVISSIFNSSSNFTLASQLGSSNFLTGQMDEARIYNRALSPSEVAQLYNFAPGPVAYFNFDEHQGTAANDSSTNANTGTLSGNASWAQGKYGGGVTLDGNGDVVTAGTGSSISITGAISVEAWVKVATLPGSGQGYSIVAKDKNTGGRAYTLDLLTSAGCLGTCFRFYISGGGNLATNEVTATANQVQTNTWYHVVGTFVPSTSQHIYINGVLADTNTVTSPLSAIPTATANLTVGAREYVGALDYFNGTIDEPRIYNYARTAGQIVEDMNADHPAPGSPVGSPISYWKLDQGYGTTANNSISGQPNFTLTAAPNDPAWTQDGKFGKALAFDGAASVTTEDYAGATFTAQTWDQGTISLWLRPDSLPGSEYYPISDYDTNSGEVGGWLIAIESDGSCSIRGNAIYTDTCPAGVFAANRWTHLVFVVDKTNAVRKIYINGVLKTTATGNTYGFRINALLRMGMGSWCTTASDCIYPGLIDEVKIYNSALTPAQVKLEYNRGQSLVLGATSDTSGLTGGQVASNSASAEYCVPGDTTSCAVPIGRWDFEEGSGSTTNDTSGNGNTGTWQGTAPYYTQGKVGKSGTFNGSNNYASVTNTSALGVANVKTISLWYYPTNLSNTLQRIIMEAADANNGWSITQAASGDPDVSTIIVSVKSGGSQVDRKIPNNSITVNNWYHIEAVVTSSSITAIYLNGIPQTLSTISSIPTITSTALLTIGARTDTTRPLSGKIDQVRLFDYARSAAQIAWDYNQGKPMNLWKMDECQGSTIGDSMGNDNGTLTVGASGTQTGIGTCSTSGTARYNGVSGKFNYSINFDGTDDYISVADSARFTWSDKATLSSWFKTSDKTVTRSILGKAASPGNYEFNFSLETDGRLRCWFSTNGSAISTLTYSITKDYADNSWHHAACVYNGSNITVYVDGVPGTSQSFTGNIFNSSSALRIGHIEDGGANWFWKGQLDDSMVFNYALTRQQIKNLMNQGGAVRYGPLTGTP